LQVDADGPPGGDPQFQDFLPTKILETLSHHNVSFIVIGGLAARAHGSPTLTEDIDICYERSRSNIQALASALRDLGATLRGVEPGLPFQLDAKTIELGDSFTFRTTAGNCDILGTPSGTTGFADLVRKAVDVRIGAIVVKVTSLDDLIRMKRTAGRPKDRIELEILGALRDEIDRE
jgi:hypothetical protein